MKKALFIFSVFHFSFFTLSAQSKWSPRANLPDSARGYGVGFSIGNYGYAGLGGKLMGKWKFFTDFWQFNPSNNSWTRKADFPGRARICPTTFVIGNCAYVVCGAENNSGNDLQTECWQYNSITDKWAQKKNFPGLSRYSAVGFAIGNKGYMGTGYDTLFNNVLKDFWEYDTIADTWTRKNDFGGIARYAASGFAVGGNGYICFGADSDGAFNYITANDMWKYDTTTDSWTQKSSNLTDSLATASGFVIGNNIYVGTGESYFPVRGFTSFWQYNTITDTWTQEANFIGGKRCVCSAFAVGDTGYLGLGIYDTSFIGTTTMYKFLADSTTGINELQAYATYINVYPNPFSENCIIFIADNYSYVPQSLKLYDIEGREIEMTIKKMGSNYSLKRDNLPDGTYILSIEFNDQIIHKKLIITN